LDLDPERALTLKKAALVTQPNNPEVLWRHSRALVTMAERLNDKNTKLASYEDAKSFAEKVISVEPKMMTDSLRRAFAWGKHALAVSLG